MCHDRVPGNLKLQRENLYWTENVKMGQRKNPFKMPEMIKPIEMSIFSQGPKDHNPKSPYA